MYYMGNVNKNKIDCLKCKSNFIRKHQGINCSSSELTTEIKLKNPNVGLR